MKKALVLVLSFVLVVSFFAGCQNETVTTDVGTMTREEIKEFEEASGGIKLPITTNGETIVFMSESSNTGMTDSVVIKELSRRTGAKIEVLELPAASMSEKAKVLIASKESMPDVVAAGIEAEQLDDLGMQGAFEPINNHIDKLPNFQKLFIDEAKERRTEKVMMSWKAADGNLYRFPSYGINRDVNHGMLYRKDIFDKHGLKMWDSPETFYQTLKKLKELYPDSTPLVSKTGSTFFRDILASWGIQGWPGAYFDHDENVWKSSAIDPTYREFLNYVKKLYDEKLLDPEFLTSTQPAWRAYGMKEHFVIHALAVGLQYHVQEVLHLLRCVYVQLGGSAQQGHGAYEARQSEDVVAMVVADEDVSYLQHAEAKSLHGCLHAFAAIYHVVLASQFQDLRGGLVA